MYRFMAAIFNFRHTQTSESIPTSLSVLPTPIHGYSRWNFLAIIYELRYTLLPLNFRIMTAIFGFRHIQTSDSDPTSLSGLPDPENMVLAVGIPLRSCIRAEISVCHFYSRLMATTLISDIPRRRTVFPLVSLCCPTPKTWV